MIGRLEQQSRGIARRGIGCGCGAVRPLPHRATYFESRRAAASRPLQRAKHSLSRPGQHVLAGSSTSTAAGTTGSLPRDLHWQALAAIRRGTHRHPLTKRAGRIGQSPNGSGDASWPRSSLRAAIEHPELEGVRRGVCSTPEGRHWSDMTLSTDGWSPASRARLADSRAGRRGAFGRPILFPLGGRGRRRFAPLLARPCPVPMGGPYPLVLRRGTRSRVTRLRLAVLAILSSTPPRASPPGPPDAPPTARATPRRRDRCVRAWTAAAWLATRRPPRRTSGEFKGDK